MPILSDVELAIEKFYSCLRLLAKCETAIRAISKKCLNKRKMLV